MNSERLKEILPSLGRLNAFIEDHMDEFEMRFDIKRMMFSVSFQQHFVILASIPLCKGIKVIPMSDFIEWIDSLEEDCTHEWVSAKNKVVTNGEICVKCHAIRQEEYDEV